MRRVLSAIVSIALTQIDVISENTGDGFLSEFAHERRKALDLVAIGRSKVLPSRKLLIERGDLVQPIDDLFVGHRGSVATSPFRFFAEERGISRNRGVRQSLIHIALTFARRGAIQRRRADQTAQFQTGQDVLNSFALLTEQQVSGHSSQLTQHWAKGDSHHRCPLGPEQIWLQTVCSPGRQISILKKRLCRKWDQRFEFPLLRRRVSQIGSLTTRRLPVDWGSAGVSARWCAFHRGGP
jgi:hypothetical protein